MKAHESREHQPYVGNDEDAARLGLLSEAGIPATTGAIIRSSADQLAASAPQAEALPEMASTIGQPLSAVNPQPPATTTASSVGVSNPATIVMSPGLSANALTPTTTTQQLVPRAIPTGHNTADELGSSSEEDDEDSASTCTTSSDERLIRAITAADSGTLRTPPLPAIVPAAVARVTAMPPPRPKSTTPLLPLEAAHHPIPAPLATASVPVVTQLSAPAVSQPSVGVVTVPAAVVPLVQTVPPAPKSRKRKASPSEDGPTDRSRHVRSTIESSYLTTNLINMKDTFVLNEAALEDSAVAAKAFLTQAVTPNFDVDYNQIITKGALELIQYKLATIHTELGITFKETKSWPIKADGSRHTLRQMATTIVRLFGQEENPLTVYDFDKNLKQFAFKFSFKNSMIEAKSWRELFTLLNSFYGDYETIPPERQDELCKVFYKKLPPVDNDFTRRFEELTKIEVPLLPDKKDTITAVQERFIKVITAARGIVTSAAKMGGENFVWDSSTPEVKAISSSSNSVSSSSSSLAVIKPVTYDLTKPAAVVQKPIAKKATQPDDPPPSTEVEQCYTCGIYGHNRRTCRYHLNAHANCTHMKWKDSMAGYNHFVKDVYLLGFGVSTYTDTIPLGRRFRVPHGRYPLPSLR